MNVLTAPTEAAVRTFVNPGRGWWNDKNLIALARRTAFKECNADEFDQAVAFCKERQLSPLTGQLVAFVFNKGDDTKRNMVLVTTIMGYRAIANRSGDYMPGPAKAFFDDAAKNPFTNPRGIVRAEASVERFIHGGWKVLTEEAFWETYAPIVKVGADEDAYEWVETGEKWEDSGKAKKRKKLRAGAEIKLIIDPRKDGWVKMGDIMLKKCPEAAALRRAWPEDLSGLYVEEEIDRSRVIDGDYVDITPSSMAEQAEAEKRIERLGGPSILVSNDHGVLERVTVGKFADHVMAAIDGKPAEYVASFVARNRVAVNEFWGHNKTDALALKKVLEERAGNAKPSTSGDAADRPAPSEATSQPQTGAGESGPGLGQGQMSKDVQANKAGLKAQLLAEIDDLQSKIGCLQWARDVGPRLDMLPKSDRADVETAFLRKQGELKD